jgi:hypothetical protein
MNPEEIIDLPVHVLEKIYELSDKYNLNPITLLIAALNEYDKNWNDVFETHF